MIIELAVGSRFYYEGKLYKVVKDGCCLNGCVFRNSNKCDKIKCSSSERHDKTNVYFKEVNRNRLI